MARIIMCEEMTEGLVEGLNIPVLGVGVEADSFEEAHELACQRYHQWLSEKGSIKNLINEDEDEDDYDYEDDDNDEENWWE